MTRFLALPLALLAAAAAHAQTCGVELGAFPLGPDAGFGVSVAVSGDRAAVGVPGRNGGDGEVRIFARTFAGDWTLDRVVSPPVAGMQGAFGTAVDLAISDPRILVVGAPEELQGRGAAYQYDLTLPATVALRTTMTAPAGAPGDRFGAAVAVDGSGAVVGAPGEGATGAGAVHIWYRVGLPSWLYLGSFVSPAPAPGQAFGAALDSYGTRVVVGAPGTGGATNGEGAAHEYELRVSTPVSWSILHVEEHRSPSPQSGAAFGSVVAADERRIVVAEPDVDGPTTDTGAIHVYRRPQFPELAPSTLEQTILPPAPVLAGRFGAAVALRRTELLVGHPAAARVDAFTRRPDLVWEPTYTYDAPPAAAGFGLAVAAGDAVNLVSAPGAAVGVPSVQGAGNVYLWDLTGGDCDRSGRADDCEIGAGLSPDCNGNGVPDGCEVAAGTVLDANGNLVPDGCEPLGVTYCAPGAPNTAGGGGAALWAVGSGLAAQDDVLIGGAGLPPLQFALLVNGTAADFNPFAGGSLGILCLGGSLGRHVGDLTQVSGVGTVEIPVRPTMLPSGAGFVSVVPGETWRFQLWYRDAFAGVTVSNFSSALEMTFN